MIIILLLSFIGIVSGLDRKMINGPYQDFNNFVLPNPDQSALYSNHYSQIFNITSSQSWETVFPVYNTNSLTFSVISKSVDDLILQIIMPNGTTLTLSGASVNSFGYDGFNLPSVGYTVNVTTSGNWKTVISSTKKVSGVLVIGHNSEMVLKSQMTTYDLQQDRNVGLVIELTDSTTLSTPLNAKLELTFPDKKQATINFYDDGLHQDSLPNDNIFGTVLEANQVGYYIAKVVVESEQVYRTSTHLFPIVVPSVTLTGLAFLNQTDTHLQFNIGIAKLDDNITETYIAYSEVWATKKDVVDEYHPIGYITAIVTLINNSFTLSLDDRWINGLTSPFQLRNTYLKCLETNAILSHRDEIFVKGNINPINERPQDETMFTGPKPDNILNEQSPILLLVHGYCSGPAWPIADFPNAIEFQDFHNSRSTDQFARLINEKCGNACAIIAHSQGGLASLHLKAFYWSGLDNNNKPGRKIQTVGSPWKGSSLAGLMADIGEMFGYGCGSQNDLTLDGASLWLSTVPSDPRKEVYYYTTQYGDGLLSDCVTASNLVLQSPNDGTCEKKYADLEGGNFVNHKKGWCHTSDMKFPPQCEDHERNKEMYLLAAI